MGKVKGELKLLKGERASKIVRYPMTLERQYQRELSRTISNLHKVVKKSLLPKLPSIINEARSEDARFDAAADDMFSLLGDLKVEMSEQYPENLLESLAERRGLEASEYNLNTLRMETKQVLGVDPFIGDKGLQSAMAKFVKQNVNLIVTVHDSYFKDIQTIVTNGVTNGDSTSKITAEIMKKTGASKNRAKLIARDQIGKFNSNLNAIRQSELGIKKFVWQTVGDERVRPSHARINGKVFSYKRGAYVDGVWTYPGMPINCRCVARPVFSKKEFS